ncbi:MAG TPA: hydroxyacylglutathione hydrolase [Candidatus Accumulibacter phosphatis]|nr:MAG: Hydroxyacylglutathione hydrolase [Candidatus Accumulibacter sp. SK-11]HAY29758.1 hydroxyacylglutathione hydrolase [Accumulibacter sp.]HCN68972.1 hydroxyacylglutathione hydrolase [Accumulibacter sp.]HRL77790.1 hydroxyacylglutathione hydrolase [Candidatus Accumulibacter phosphatis]HRQ96328.1 hydroxyacylglutathione hydrolase [Candidatus Accumulibacter phosphatis]
MFDVIRIPAFKDNYIWLLRKGAAAAVVDPGDARPVLEVLEREGLTLASILITHHHADHQGGVAALLAHYRAEVFGPAAEPINGVSRPLRGGETIHPAGCDSGFTVIAVPGHTLGHLAYYGSGCLFCGDTLFAGGCGRLFEGTPAQMLASLACLAALPDETAVYCAHEYTQANLRFALAVEPGNRDLQCRLAEVIEARARGLATVPSTIACEKASNPFLRCTQPEVVESARHRGAGTADKVAVFTALREWKNSF